MFAGLCFDYLRTFDHLNTTLILAYCKVLRVHVGADVLKFLTLVACQECLDKQRGADQTSSEEAV